MSPITSVSRSQEDVCSMSSHEAPSPASTYGQTLDGGDSVPATPSSEFVSAASLDPPPYRIEVMLDRCKNATAAVRRGLGLATSDSSPAALASMVQDLAVNRSRRSNSDHLAEGNQSDDVFGHRDVQLPVPSTEVSEPTNQDQNADLQEASNLYSPRPDRQGHKVTADNAQAHLKPECCIFVANLPSARPDAMIGNALNDIFSRFGKCFVKLKRDRGMPIAFVQYDNSADASQALDQGSGLIVLGRKCRTERAKAPRCVYVSRRDGTMPSEAEVVGLLTSRGEVEKTWAPTETEQELHKLPPGFFVRFAYYQDAVDAMNALRDIPKYHVEAQQAPKSPSLFDPASVLARPHPQARPPLFDPSKHDNRALWIGDLPETITKSDLARVFGGIGRQIRYIELRIRGNTASKAGLTSFAFIHYIDAGGAYMAACMTYNTLRLFNRRCVRVQFARKPFWQLFGNVPPYHRPIIGFNSRPVPAGQQHSAYYSQNLPTEYQANVFHPPELGYNLMYDMNNLMAQHAFRPDLCGGPFMLPQSHMSLVAPSSFTGSYFSPLQQ